MKYLFKKNINQQKLSKIMIMYYCEQNYTIYHMFSMSKIVYFSTLSNNSKCD